MLINCQSVIESKKVSPVMSSFQALISLFVFSTRDGWVKIMHNGIDAVGIDQQVNMWPENSAKGCSTDLY